MRTSVPNSQIRALAKAIAGAIAAAAATMFIPASVLEHIAGSTGFSELLQAAGVPLGDPSRALIAFAAGATTLGILFFMFTRQVHSPQTIAIDEPLAPSLPVDDEAISLKDRLAQIRLPPVSTPAVPWGMSDTDNAELTDLPRLRNGDVHPDAPPRRPLSAHQDLPVLDLASVAIEISKIEAPADEGESETPASALADEEIGQTARVRLVSSLASPDADEEVAPTLAEMVAQLEAAVAERQRQLAELEVVAARLTAERLAQPPVSREPVEVANVEIVADVEMAIEPARERPVLEAVPPSTDKDDEMDAALAAALATLQRMNGTAL